jgi:predicted MFS family arabinose efflux permease
VLAPAIALGLASYGVGTLQAFAVLRLDGPAADLLLGAFGAAFLLTRLAGSPLVDRHPAPRLMALSATLEAAGLGALPISGATGPAILGAALAGIAAALAFPVLAATVAAATRSRGAAVGALTSFWDAGIAAAAAVGGLAVAAGGLPAAFALAAGAAALAALPLRSRRGARRS